MKHYSLLFTLLFCSSCAQKENVFDVSNIKQGIFTNEEMSEIDIVGNNFPYKVNGSCTINNKRRPDCMWWGFSFNHTEMSSDYEIPCTAKTSIPITHVDPNNEYGKDMTTMHVKLPIKAGTSYSIFPSYFSKDDEDTGYLRMQVECGENDNRLFEVNISIDLDEKI